MTQESSNTDVIHTRAGALLGAEIHMKASRPLTYKSCLNLNKIIMLIMLAEIYFQMPPQRSELK